MRQELQLRVARAAELGRAAEVTPHLAESLAAFLGCRDAYASFACGLVQPGRRVVAPFAQTAAAVLAIEGDDVHTLTATEREPLVLIGAHDAAAMTVAADRTPEHRGAGHAIARATVVAAAELAGVARGALDHAVAYASTREQFGAPIATYQALAHRLVDMAIAVEAAELAVEQAAIEPMALHAARAKICANRAAEQATSGLHQVHGGVGYNAGEAPPRYFARALALSVELGATRHHLQVIGRHHRFTA